MATKKQQERKKFMVRVICIVLAVILIGSSVAAVFGIFG